MADYIREIRLRRCFTDLISPRRAGSHVSQVAYRWGFKDPSHFTRLFKSRFGAHPSELRAYCVEAGPGGAPPQDLPVGDTKYSYWIANLA